MMQRLRFMVDGCVSLWRTHSVVLVLLLAAFGATGCKLFDSTCSESDRTCLGGGKVRSGKPCVRTGDCATGLDCFDNVCRYVGSTKRGGDCIVSAECAQGLYCSPLDIQCRPMSDTTVGVGDRCATTADCASGTVCDADVAQLFREGPYALLPEDCQDALDSDETPEDCTLPRTCMKRGTVDLGSVCEVSADCLPGLFCFPDPLKRGTSICYGGQKLPIEPVSFPLWEGGECPADPAEAIAYFDLPRESGEPLDFYRLPFPNDIRRENGKVDVSSHPRPPADVEPQMAQRYVEESQTLSGFSTNPVAFFRFSREFRASDLSLSSVRIVNITKDSPEYARKESISWGPTEERSSYICSHWLGVYRPIGSPLLPNTTYAAIVTKGLRAVDNSSEAKASGKTLVEYARGADFDAMLGSARPNDATAAKAWDAYEPLRAYLNDGDPNVDISAGQVLNAAVFTTQDPAALVPQLRAAIEQDGAPALADLTACDEGVRSPCEDDDGRGACHDPQDSFTEIHGHVRLPAFQGGTAPYDTPERGGDIALRDGTTPVVQGHPDVCFALSVPKTPAPSGGYPVLIVAHQLGGSFADQMGNGGLAEWAANLPEPSVVLAIDMPVHGSRRNGSSRPPQDLYFNVLNPKSTRGNVLQGASDLMSLTLLAAEPIPRRDSPTGEAIPFDAARVALWGDWQGATAASLMIGSEPRVRSAVLSGLAGHVTAALRDQTKPVDMSTVLPFLLFDPDFKARLSGGDANPMLALMQGYLDAADPINYARQLLTPPDSAPNGHDVFMVYGRFDGFTSERSQSAYANAGGLSAVDPDLTVSFTELPSPATGNVTLGTQERTVALKTYDPRVDAIDESLPQDGHFVAIATAPGVADVRRFLAAALSGQTPPIGPTD